MISPPLKRQAEFLLLRLSKDWVEFLPNLDLLTEEQETGNKAQYVGLSKNYCLLNLAAEKNRLRHTFYGFGFESQIYLSFGPV